MRNKVISILLFLITFAVMHDAILAKLDHESQVQAPQTSLDSTISCDTGSVHDVHHLFHFIAVVFRTHDLPGLPLRYAVQQRHLTPCYPAFLERDNKPPIA